MRTVSLIIVCAGLLSACSLFSRGDPEVPEGDAWRQEVADVIATTPGVVRSTVTVHDVDPGFGGSGPVMTGTIVIASGEDPQQVLDAAMRAASDVMGEHSSGVGVRPGVTIEGRDPGKLRDHPGYESVRNGKDLWEATH